MNLITIAGVVEKLTTKNLENGMWCRISLAVRTNTEAVNRVTVDFSGSIADDVAANVAENSSIICTGELRSGNYQKDGKTIYYTKMQATSFSYASESTTLNVGSLMGRLTRDPDVRYSTGEKPMAIARFTMALDRRFKTEGEQPADFIQCVAFGKTGEFVEKYLHKGTKIAAAGHIQTGHYTNRNGEEVDTFDFNVSHLEFAESKSANQSTTTTSTPSDIAPNDIPDIPTDVSGMDMGFMNIPDGLVDEMPFN